MERDNLLRGEKIIWGTLIYTRRTSALQTLEVVHKNRKLESLKVRIQILSVIKKMRQKQP